MHARSSDWGKSKELGDSGLEPLSEDVSQEVSSLSPDSKDVRCE